LQEVLLFPAMKPDDPNKPKEDVTEAAAEWPLLWFWNVNFGYVRLK
jgi:hypothetical protein